MTVRLPDELHESLRLLAAVRGVSIQRLVVDALERDVERQQADPATAEAISRIRNVRQD